MNRRQFLRAAKLRLLAYGLPLVAGGTYGFAVEPRWLRLARIDLVLPALPPALDGLRIVQLSDLHLLPYVQPEHIRNAVALANAQQPDLVVLTGDYADTEEALALLPGLLGELRAPLGRYAILGNHDMWLGQQEMLAALRTAEITPLENRGVLLKYRGAALYLAGLKDGFSGHPDLTAALADLPDAVPCIVLAHEPDLADDIARSGRVHVQLSGHSHGGQVRLPWIGAPVLPPMAERYPEGLRRIGEMWLYTSRGVGLIGPPFGPPVRFNCRPEVVLLTLRAK